MHSVQILFHHYVEPYRLPSFYPSFLAEEHLLMNCHNSISKPESLPNDDAFAMNLYAE
jgi:hypothetical protein